MVLHYADFRKMVEGLPRYPHTEVLQRSPLFHRGFHGTFNSSFIEYHELSRLGGYFNHTKKDFLFSTIQSCIRFQDFPQLKTDASWMYLGAFEMGDVHGCLHFKKRPDYESMQRLQISRLFDLFKKLKIDLGRVHPTYQGGGSVREISRGKYNFDFQVPEDLLSKRLFLEMGVPEENLMPDQTRDTFLSLHIHRPMPWGYRNEILISCGEKKRPRMLDCATLEYTLWEPLYSGRPTSHNVSGLKNMKDGFSVALIGLERLCMVANGLERVQDVDYIKPVYDYFEGITGRRDWLAVESLRALHRIYADVENYKIGGQLGRSRMDKVKKLIGNVMDSDITLRELEELLYINNTIQPWHDLLDGITPLMKRVEEYSNTPMFKRKQEKKERYKRYLARMRK
ncbi:MAG: hypothetical protein JXB14_03545 [Candidatus Altiarchaeota archaeon]|nr:hypothetical protein [Candidatus Altiarchaeota archaeon]